MPCIAASCRAAFAACGSCDLAHSNARTGVGFDGWVPGMMPPLQQQADELRVRLIREAFRFARAASAVAGVRRISLLGSILTSAADPKDVDLLVRIADDADLSALAACARRLKGRTQAFNRGADVFLADEAGRYLGRACPWKACRPGVRVSCDALHCGARPHLHDDLGTIELPATLVASPPLDLWPTLAQRCELPADVARLLTDSWSPVAIQGCAPVARGKASSHYGKPLVS